MRSYVDAKAFTQALEHICKLTRKSSIPALEGILVRFEHDGCSLTATDITTWLTVKLHAPSFHERQSHREGLYR